MQQTSQHNTTHLCDLTWFGVVQMHKYIILIKDKKVSAGKMHAIGSFALSLFLSLYHTSFHPLSFKPSVVSEPCMVWATLYWSENLAFIAFWALGIVYISRTVWSVYIIPTASRAHGSIRLLQFLSLSFNHMHRILSKFKPICRVSLVFFARCLLAVCAYVGSIAIVPCNNSRPPHIHTSNAWHFWL